jgi:hypothetical protein
MKSLKKWKKKLFTWVGFNPRNVKFGLVDLQSTLQLNTCSKIMKQPTKN